MKTQTQIINIGAAIKINTRKGVATAKVIAKCPLDRVQIIECSLPQFNNMIVDSEDIIEVLEVEETDYRKKYEELLAQNKELKYQADLKDFAMKKVALQEIAGNEIAKERDAYRSKFHKLEHEVISLKTEVEFLKKFSNWIEPISEK